MGSLNKGSGIQKEMLQKGDANRMISEGNEGGSLHNEVGWPHRMG